jgi:hypothetical protein
LAGQLSGVVTHITSNFRLAAGNLWKERACGRSLHRFVSNVGTHKDSVTWGDRDAEPISECSTPGDVEG